MWSWGRASSEREGYAAAAMADMKAWLCQDMSLGRVAIFDGTNTTVARRTWILKELSDILSSKSNVVFVESICRDQEIIDYNILEVCTRLLLPWRSRTQITAHAAGLTGISQRMAPALIAT
jgi:hypothetical protein|eukprot:COSAG01_NODE_18202_length_1093_cov_1.870221_2_plen_121_part_00